MTFRLPRSALPGFPATFALAWLWVSLIVLLPLTALALRPWTLGWSGFWEAVSEPRVLAALKLSFGAAALAAAINVPLGLLVAWVMARYRFPGRNLLFGLIALLLLVPNTASLIPLFVLMRDLGLLNSYPDLITPQLTTQTVFSVVLMKT